MKRFKKLYAVILAAAMVLSSAASVLAAEQKVPVLSKTIFLGSDVNDTYTAAMKLGIITESTDMSAVVTRKNLCRFIVRFYRASTGAIGITITDSPFYDCDANEVIFCYENGMIEGISDVTFAPEYYVSREEACEIIVNAVKFCGANVIEPGKDYTFTYQDKSDIGQDYIDDVSYLSSLGIVKGYDGYFYPKSYITYDQLASMLVETYYQLMISEIGIRGQEISIGDSQDEIKKLFGTPSYRVDDKTASVDIWVYNKNMNDFFYVAFSNGKVSEFFSNGTTFSFRGITSGSSILNLDYGSRAMHEQNKVVYTDGYGKTILGSFSGSDKIEYIYVVPNNNWQRHEINSSSNDGDKRLLLDIINAERVKNSLPVFTTHKNLMSTANVHSMNMGYWDYVDYNNKEGATPFDRFDSRKLKYSMASENITMLIGSPADVYDTWMNTPGARSNILTNYMDNVGIGINVRQPNNKAYVVMDFIKLR